MNTQSPVSIVFAGGGTAGHVSPIIAMAEAITAEHRQARITMIGTEQGMEATLIPEAGYTLRTIERVRIPRSLSPQLLTVPSKLSRSIKEAKEILRSVQADVVVGVGGYVSGPAYLAAKSLKIPVIVHEANVTAGWTNKIASRWAQEVATSFGDTELAGATLVGLPVRSSITELDRAAQRQQARQDLGLDPELLTLVLTGGSSGAATMNKAVSEFVPDLAESGVQLLHITGAGKANRDADGNLVQAAGYVQREYVESMGLAYAAADLLIARAGANTVAEVASVQLPTIFVPLPIGNGEQELNAGELVAAEAALLVADKAFTAEYLREIALPLLAHPEQLARMSENTKATHHATAAKDMAELIIRTATEHQAGQA